MRLPEILLFLFLLFLALSCATTKSQEAIVQDYFDAYNSKDYKALNKLISDGIVLIDNGNTILSSKQEFVDLVEMGEVLHGKNTLDKMQVASGNVVVLETHINDRMRFFDESPLQMRSTFTIKGNKIVKINTSLVDKVAAQGSERKQAFHDWAQNEGNINWNEIYQLNRSGAEALKRAFEAFELFEAREQSE